jgi:hypothetical protein
MSDDLAKRLRETTHIYQVDCELKMKCADRIEELEAKLAKAVEALVQMVGKKDYADDPWGIARTTLAELKGQADE